MLSLTSGVGYLAVPMVVRSLHYPDEPCVYGYRRLFFPILCNRLRLIVEAAMGVCLIVTAANAALATTLHIAVGNRFATGLVL